MPMQIETTRKATASELVAELAERTKKLEEKEKKADSDWSTSSFIDGLFLSGFICFICFFIFLAIWTYH